MLKQYVWGLQYIDELVQVGYNQDPANATSSFNPGYTENQCEYYYYPMQDANFNVLGLVNESGRLVERYEYTPYGQRTVYTHRFLRGDVNGDGFVGIQDHSAVLAKWNQAPTGPEPADVNGDGFIGTGDLNAVLGNWNAGYADSADKQIMYPTLASARVTQLGIERAGPALCEVGHQGLFHDEEFGSRGGLIYNRTRILNPRLGRFMQQDPLGYVDGMNLYQYVSSSPTNWVDPFGTRKADPGYPEGVPDDDCCKGNNEKVSDDAGRKCCEESISTVNVLLFSGSYFPISYPHASIQTPSQCRGHYPVGYNNGPGVTHDDNNLLKQKKPSVTIPIKACPETRERLENSIDNHHNDPYHDLNYGARNCAGWVLERLQDAGVRPFGKPDGGFLDPGLMRPLAPDTPGLSPSDLANGLVPE